MHNTNVAVALLCETPELGRHLRDALTSLGTPIVYEAAPANLDVAALENSGARVVVVNLDPTDESDLDDVYDLLENDRYSVVFNDAQASSALSGWDQARWARHLAAKILGDADIDPPRPEGAESVPAPVAVATSEPIVSTADEHETDEPEMASEPQASYDTGLQSIVADAGDEPPASATDTHAPQDMLESRYDEMNRPPADVFPSSQPPPADGFDFSTLEALTAAPPASPDAPTELSFDAGFLDEAHFDDENTLEAAPPSTDGATATPSDSMSLADMAFDDTADDDAGEPVPARDTTHAVEHAETDHDELALEGNDVDIGDVFDLDALEKLFGDEPIAMPAAASSDKGAIDGVDDYSSIDPVEIEERSVDATHAEEKHEDGSPALSIVEDIDFGSTPTPTTAPVAPEPTVAALKLAAAADWSLEDMLDGDAPPPPVSPPTGRADFGIEKLSAAEYLAPASDTGAPPATPQLDDDFSFELMPMEEAIAPQAVETKPQEVWLDPDKTVAPARIRRVWVLGASIGGPEAVREFLGHLPRDYPALFLLAQHMGAEFVDLMAQQLAKSTQMTVRTPTHGERVGHGEVVVVPTTHRLQVDPAEGIVVLERVTSEGAYNPSIDRVLRDVADRYGANAGAIIFSGMTTDAIDGAKHLAAKGGTVYAQHPDTCVVSTMVDGVVEAGIVKVLGTPKELADVLLADTAKSKR